jgi:hypothetical protein
LTEFPKEVMGKNLPNAISQEKHEKSISKTTSTNEMDKYPKNKEE